MITTTATYHDGFYLVAIAKEDGILESLLKKDLVGNVLKGDYNQPTGKKVTVHYDEPVDGIELKITPPSAQNCESLKEIHVTIGSWGYDMLQQGQIITQGSVRMVQVHLNS
jgi:hypothetical protein